MICAAECSAFRPPPMSQVLGIESTLGWVSLKLRLHRVAFGLRGVGGRLLSSAVGPELPGGLFRAFWVFFAVFDLRSLTQSFAVPA